MRAVVCRDWGGPEDLKLEDLPSPLPGDGEVLLDVAAAGVNFADTLMIAGKYQERPAFPFSPGLEVAGRIKALGPGVTGLSPGQRVLALTDRGGYAEAALARAGDVFPIPDGLGWAEAAGFPITYGTAHGALRWHARLQAGETLLVHGAAGGVGLAAVEIGKAIGARVIATAGGPDKLAVAKAHGADDLIDYRSEDIRERVKALTDGQGADVVFDPVGGDVFDASLRCIAWSGRLLIIGFAAGRVPQIPANILLVKNIAAMGIYWGSYRQKAPALLAEEFRELFAWFEEGRLKPHVSHKHDLAEAAEAMALLLNRRSTGKVVLTTGAA
ncbi:NADPH:quinone oxidoreductase family protein [Pelagibius litoralis]|uniref:NADPH:quinone oxidoreductase family protein n=1 Tax=Pelagibius litoralis TaxID=374515 RepID=A0A967EV50_9PROT|nr:NADPH:quinone oxidoreductase family protein [Pelagibius litoralis]NIA68151.1 NADPH:quinone oxidoreductase family protein [Pelagibius litoralis]